MSALRAALALRDPGAQAPHRAAAGPRRALLDRASVFGWLLLPTLALLLVVLAFPLVYAVWLSLTATRVAAPGAFIGLANYRRLLRAPR